MSHFDEIMEMYNTNRRQKNCPDCKKSHKNKKVGPFTLFHIGQEFEEMDKKILFVGKNTWFDKKEYKELENSQKKRGIDHPFIDVIEIGKSYLETRCTAFWRLIIEIANEIHETKDYFDSIEKIAVSNLMKCNLANGWKDKNNTKSSMKENCINENKIIQNEIEILKPTHIIFFTSGDYEGWLDEGLKEYKNFEKTEFFPNEKNFKGCWNSNWGWVLGKLKIKDYDQETEFIRTYHPNSRELKTAKKIFLKDTVEWINHQII